jgi:hypothetical protein
MIHLRAGRLLICYQRCNQIAEGGPTPRAALYAAHFDLQARWPEALLAPDGTHNLAAPLSRHIDDAVVKAVARAFVGGKC